MVRDNPPATTIFYARKCRLPAGLLLLILLGFMSLTSRAKETKTFGESSFGEISAAAHNGDAGAQVALAQRYFHGKGILKDNVEGLEWLNRAVEQNNALAQATLGDCYLN